MRGAEQEIRVQSKFPIAANESKGGWRNALLNAALAAGGIAAVLLLCEMLLFRLVLTPSDVPPNVFIDGLVRLAPGSAGVWRVGADVAGPYWINEQGWNSGHGSYTAQAPAGIKRIAIIGDSFVEALQVPYDASLAERLEGAAQGRVEVYRFGISGAPLSQYLHMARHVAQKYRPDMIVLVLVHNDFDESFSAAPGRYTSSFLKFRMAGDRVAGEIAPAPYAATWRDWLRQTATLRYLYYRQKLDPAALIARFSPGAARVNYQANVAVDAIAARRGAIRGAASYAFAQFQALSRRQNFRPLLIMDGDRQAITAGADAAALREHGALWLNGMAAEAAAAAGLAFIDLHPLFEADWRQNRQPLNFRSDNHWNETGHRVAAQALQTYLVEHPL